MSKTAQLSSIIRQAATPLVQGNYDTILQAVGDAKVVMIGEASHGTHEFYHHRAELTKKLITEKGFDCVCVEGDWPDAYQINRFARGHGTLNDAFSGFKRFPTWMWRNTVTSDFAKWLRKHNEKESEPYKVGFYGLDLYSLHSSVHAVIDYLLSVDPPAAKRAKHRYSIFDHYGKDPQSYGMAAAFGMSNSCEDGAVKMLMEMRERVAKSMEEDTLPEIDREFYACMNAEVVKDAEQYYRGMFQRKNTWNIRDGHMTRTLEQLMSHLGTVRGRFDGDARKDKPIRAVVWAHNSHLGDARFTEFADRGEQNVGQLSRQQFGRERTYNVGFSTFDGTVTAAHEWDDPAETMQVRPAIDGTYEKLFHECGGDFVVRFRTNPSGDRLSPNEESAVKALSGKSLLERAIGVIYRPRTERQSHLFQARIADQFDAVIHIDRTSALKEVDDSYLSSRQSH